MSADEIDHRPASPFVWLPVWLSVLIHVGAWLLLGYWMAVRVPFSQAIFADFGVELPELTILVFNVSDLLMALWFVPPILLAIVIGGDVIVDRWLARQERYQLRLVWFLAGLIVPVGALLIVVAALDLMFLQLLTELRNPI
jgi:type II secretory pathway component PulF